MQAVHDNFITAHVLLAELAEPFDEGEPERPREFPARPNRCPISRLSALVLDRIPEPPRYLRVSICLFFLLGLAHRTAWMLSATPHELKRLEDIVLLVSA